MGKYNSVRFARELLELRLRLEDFNEDKKYIEEGNDIFYAIDTNIILFYANPDKKSKYAWVFKNDSDSVRKVMSWSLCDYLFSVLVKKRPLLIIPPHVQELERVLRSILNDAAREGEIFLQLPDEIKKIAKDPEIKKDPKKILYHLEKNVLGLIRYALGKEYSSETDTSRLKRINGIMDAKKVINIDNYCEYENNNWCFPVLDVKRDVAHYSILKDSAEKWFHLLKKFKSREYKNLYDDAFVLSKIMWINDTIKKEKKRLVLITSASVIQQAAELYYCYDYGQTFMDLFIRDPRSFFGAPEFVSKKENSNHDMKIDFKDLSNMIDVGFSGYLNKNEGKRAEIKKLINDEENFKNYISGIVRERNKIKREWEKIVTVVSVKYGINECEKLDENILKDISEAEKIGLSEILYERFFLVWLSFWRVTTKAGFLTMKNIGKIVENHNNKFNARIPIRGVPILKITFKKARKELYHLCKSLIHESVIENTDLFSDLKDEDSSGYTAFLLYAVAFGMVGQWKITKTLAGVAYEISNHISDVKQQDDDNEKITGNEAAYLLGWSKRNDAKKIDDLDEAEEYLIEAQARSAKAVGTNECSDKRYESEMIWLKLTRVLYCLFVVSCDKKITYTNILYGCQKKAISMIESKEISYVYDVLIGEIKIKNESEKEYLFMMDLSVFRQLITGIFMVDIFLRFKEGVKINSDYILRNKLLFAKLEALCDFDDFGTKTCMTYSIYLISSIVYGEKDKKAKIKEAKQYFDPVNIKDCYSHPYDESMFKYFYDIVCLME